MSKLWYLHIHEVACHVYRQLRRYLSEDVIRDLIGDANVIAELEKKWEQLTDDRTALRQIFPTGDSKVNRPIYLSVSSLFEFLFFFQSPADSRG